MRPAVSREPEMQEVWWQLIFAIFLCGSHLRTGALGSPGGREGPPVSLGQSLSPKVP